jgi:LPS sulfotransferase NodH
MDAGSTVPVYDLTTADHDYPPWQGVPIRTILICTHPRSGSTLLGEAFYFADGLGCPLEYFHDGFRPALARRWNAHAIGSYVDEVHRHRTDPGGTLGVKLFWRDVSELAQELDPAISDLDLAPERVAPETYRKLADMLAPIFPAPQLIHLERRDRLRQAVSGVVATDTGHFRAIPESGVPAPRAEPEFDYDRIEQLIGYSDFCHRHWRNLFAAMDAAPLKLTYEALIADYEATVAGALAYLGSDSAVPPARMRRQADSRNEAFVLRYLRERAARAAA